VTVGVGGGGAVAVPVPVAVADGDGVTLGVCVTVGVTVGRLSGKTMSRTSSMNPGAPGIVTRARMRTAVPCRLRTYLMQESASPGSGTTVNAMLHGCAWLVKPGLVTDTPATGFTRLKSTSTLSPTTTPDASVTKAPMTLVNDPSPLSLRWSTTRSSLMKAAGGVGTLVGVGGGVLVAGRLGVAVGVGGP